MRFHNTIEASQLLWDYMRINQPLEKADAIIVPGCYNTHVAAYAAEIYHQGFAPVIVVSGGVVPEWSDSSLYGLTEAEAFRSIAIDNGVPESSILVENQATNTYENLLYAQDLLDQNGYKSEKIILTQQPSFERRLRATAQFRWPEKRYFVTSAPMSMEEHIAQIGSERALDSLISDFQRLETYRGRFLEDENIPSDLWDAFEYLVQSGCCKRLAEPAEETLRRVRGNAHV